MAAPRLRPRPRPPQFFLLVSCLYATAASAAALGGGGGGGGSGDLRRQGEWQEPLMGPERVVFQTSQGDIVFGFFPEVAPVTVAHISTLARLGCYNGNHFFRVDRGFVAQVAAVIGGRKAALNAEQQVEAEKSVVGEFSPVKHVRGVLSMGRYDDPDSATSSFSILLGDAPHLDEKYAVFGKIVSGDETLKKMEELPTKTEGIFVMPVERITISSTYVYDVRGPDFCCRDVEALKRQLQMTEHRLEAVGQLPRAKSWKDLLPSIGGPFETSHTVTIEHRLKSDRATRLPLSEMCASLVVYVSDLWID